MVLETHMKLRVTESASFLKRMPQKWKSGPKTGFSEFSENYLKIFVVRFWSTREVYIISYIPAQIHKYLRKIWFLSHRPKCSWPTRLQDF